MIESRTETRSTDGLNDRCILDGDVGCWGNATAGLALTVMVSVPVPVELPEREIWAGLNWQLIPLDGRLHPRLTEPLRPCFELTLMIKVCELPTEIVAEVGETVPEKVPLDTIS
jgi:hypothetical protein